MAAEVSIRKTRADEQRCDCTGGVHLLLPCRCHSEVASSQAAQTSTAQACPTGSTSSRSDEQVLQRHTTRRTAMREVNSSDILQGPFRMHASFPRETSKGLSLVDTLRDQSDSAASTVNFLGTYLGGTTKKFDETAGA